MAVMRFPPLLLSLACCVGLASCGAAAGDTAIDAQEQNGVSLDGLDYRVHLFRRLNPRAAPDSALVDRPPPGAGHALYAALLRVCDEGGSRRAATGDIHLEDAFGNRFQPLEAGIDDDLGYDTRELSPGDCLPAPDSSAARTYDGAALVFGLPLEAARRRLLVLALGDSARIELDR